MQFDNEFSDLVGLIYDCALDQSLWRSVLEQICNEMDGYMADLTVFDAVSGETRLVTTFNMEDAFLEIVARNAHLHPLLPMGLVAPWVSRSVPPGRSICRACTTVSTIETVGWRSAGRTTSSPFLSSERSRRFPTGASTTNSATVFLQTSTSPLPGRSPRTSDAPFVSRACWRTGV